MKRTLYGASLVCLSFMVMFVLRTHAPSPAAERADAATPADVTVGGTPDSMSHSNQAHSSILSNASQESRERLVKNYGTLPLSFELNRGQTDPQVKFLARGPGYTVFLTSTEAVLALNGSDGGPGGTSPKQRLLEHFRAHPSPSSAAVLKLAIPTPKASRTPLRYEQTRSLAQSELPGSPEPRASAALRMTLVGANRSPRVAGLETLSGKSNYFVGNDPNKWRPNVSLYARVKYDNVYPGVDLVYYGNQGQLEYDFVVAPGADPKAINLAIQGSKRVDIDSLGDLVVDMGDEEVRFHKPTVYQPESPTSEMGRRTVRIDGAYVLRGENQVGFRIAEYDTSKPLVIDPVLRYSTYLGGGGDEDLGNFLLDAVAVDSRGNAYVIGWTNSTDFPTTPGAFQATLTPGTCGAPPDTSPCNDAFVAKLNAAGTALVYSTYVGGSGQDFGQSIAVDRAGNAYFSGETSSTDFPTMNPIQAANAGGVDSFVAKLNPAGDALVYSTYLGGSDSDGSPMIAIDPRGNAYVQGSTFSTDFPTTAGAFQVACASCSNGLPDTYVTKLNPNGTALVYSTYLGGSDWDFCGFQIAVDRGGSVYVNGFAFSADFPVTPGAFQTACASCGIGKADAFVTKLNATGTGLVYSTYLGGSGFEIINGTAVDPAGNAYVNGFTFSNDFPTKHPIQATYAGGGDAFMAQLNANGTALVYSTYLGGTDFDGAFGVAVDPAGKAYAVGTTYSTDFPTTTDGFQTALVPGTCGIPPDTFPCPDAFFTKLNRHGTRLVYSTYLGGSGDDEGGATVLDSNGNVYTVGFTTSTDFPVRNAVQPAFGGGFWDAFVAKWGSIGRSHDHDHDDDDQDNDDGGEDD